VEFSSLASSAWVPVEIEATGAGVGVRASGRMVDHSSAPVAPAGFFILEAKPGGRVEIRNMRLRLLKPDVLFNGNDLSGWKSTGEPAKQKGGLGKLFGGGKPKEAKWTVVRGMIHGCFSSATSSSRRMCGSIQSVRTSAAGTPSCSAEIPASWERAMKSTSSRAPRER
jgi:hypothetical protein